jgi:hypothetical protein
MPYQIERKPPPSRPGDISERFVFVSDILSFRLRKPSKRKASVRVLQLIVAEGALKTINAHGQKVRLAEASTAERSGNPPASAVGRFNQ